MGAGERRRAGEDSRHSRWDTEPFQPVLRCLLLCGRFLRAILFFEVSPTELCQTFRLGLNIDLLARSLLSPGAAPSSPAARRPRGLRRPPSRRSASAPPPLDGPRGPASAPASASGVSARHRPRRPFPARTELNVPGPRKVKLKAIWPSQGPFSGRKIDPPHTINAQNAQKPRRGKNPTVEPLRVCEKVIVFGR